nr:DUF2127 domain-containing protein [Pseudoclavibacter chungangensis]
MEGLPFLLLIVVLLSGVDLDDLASRLPIILPFFAGQLVLMMVMSGLFAALRIVASIGLLKNRMWGYALSVVNCVVTLVLMVFMLPAGIVDGLLSGTALVLLFVGRYGDAPVIGGPDARP